MDVAESETPRREPARPRSGQAAERLAAFPEAQIELIGGRLGSILTEPWPVIDGCLSVLFTSRAGSTFLARELETVFDIGRMREAFNPNPIMQGFAPAEIVSRRKGTWFSFKAGAPA